MRVPFVNYAKLGERVNHEFLIRRMLDKTLFISNSHQLNVISNVSDFFFLQKIYLIIESIHISFAGIYSIHKFSSISIHLIFCYISNKNRKMTLAWRCFKLIVLYINSHLGMRWTSSQCHFWRHQMEIEVKKWILSKKMKFCKNWQHSFLK